MQISRRGSALMATLTVLGQDRLDLSGKRYGIGGLLRSNLQHRNDHCQK
jgi:hypothetical protein